MKKERILAAAFITISIITLYTGCSSKRMVEDQVETQQLEMYVTQERGLRRQPYGADPNISVYELEKRSFDETEFDDETIERISAYIDSVPKNSEFLPTLEAELYW